MSPGSRIISAFMCALSHAMTVKKRDKYSAILDCPSSLHSWVREKQVLKITGDGLLAGDTATNVIFILTPIELAYFQGG